jgi:hypothetical protein
MERLIEEIKGEETEVQSLKLRRLQRSASKIMKTEHCTISGIGEIESVSTDQIGRGNDPDGSRVQSSLFVKTIEGTAKITLRHVEPPDGMGTPRQKNEIDASGADTEPDMLDSPHGEWEESGPNQSEETSVINGHFRPTNSSEYPEFELHKRQP